MIIYKSVYFVLITSLCIWPANCQDDCVTPNNEKAKCISIHSCPALLNVTNSSSPDVLDFIRKSVCSEKNRTVCCGSLSNFAEPTFEKLSRTERFCGKQHSDDYFHTISATKINEFPWLVAIALARKENQTALKTNYLCSGSLISNRYVLTSAACVTSNLYSVVSVRLGEYHIKNETDCVEDAYIFECSNPTEEAGVEDIIVHPNYSPRLVMNDIALIKLNKTIAYSVFIRPICLPLPNTSAANDDDILITSGWGRTNFRTIVDVKSKTYSRLIANDECQRFFDILRITIGENQFCTMYLKNNTEVLCGPDAGGPDMLSRRNRWYQEGIISGGFNNCSSSLPLLHTKVVNFLAWIENSIE